MPILHSYETRRELLDLIASGASLAWSCRLLGVSQEAGKAWWDKACPMTLELISGARGGLAGTSAPSDPTPDPDPDPTAARRQRRMLTSEDRAVIEAGVKQELSYAAIGSLIGRDKGVVWREVARNKGVGGAYWAPVAHRAAHQRRRRPKSFRLVDNTGLCRIITEWMDQGWSPKLIATVLKQDHPHSIMDRVSHETIYQALYVQTRGQLRSDLHRCLSLQRERRKKRPTTGTENARGQRYRDAFKIKDRPAEVEDRAVPGHWEGDLILGAGNTSAVGTLVERTTRFTILLHLPGRHDAESVAEAMIAEMSKLPQHLRQSLTWDRGSEMARYERIQLDLGLPVYFCDPHKPWQRGSNENTNRLLRFWLPKGTDLSTHTAQDLARIAATLNKRPRPTLNMQTPAQALDQLLANPAAA